MPKVADKNINGFDVEIHADSFGRWSIIDPSIESAGRRQIAVSESSLDNAISRARTELNKRRIDVNVEFIHPRSGQKGVATKRHARTGQILVVMDDGEKDALDNHARVLSPDMPQAEVERMIEAREEGRRLTAEAKTLEKKYELALGHAVDRAVEQKSGASAMRGGTARRR